ncbi:response regulator [Leptolyngbya sp. 7M]|nr:response regulator [Leptolyngbya sp. 7M]
MSISPSSLILAVDDNPTNLATLSQTLKHAGWQVRVAIDGESAIAKAHYEPPDLILLDVEMPGMNGFEVCQQLKANAATQSIPVIFTTALADLDSKVKGLSLGAVDYIIKPFEAQEVVARVQVHLQLRHLTKMLEEKSALLEASNTALQQLTQALEERVQERTAALEMAQVRLVQQEKLSVLGELVTGVAHEINNPVNFIGPPLAAFRGWSKSDSLHVRLHQSFESAGHSLHSPDDRLRQNYRSATPIPGCPAPADSDFAAGSAIFEPAFLLT